MKILVAPSSFKGSINASELARSIIRGIKKTGEKVDVMKFPVADGGLGTTEIITGLLKGEFVKCLTTGPLGERITARYGIIPKENLAVIELASAAGWHLIPAELRNPLITTTIGVGRLIAHALKRSYKRIVLGVGDSATIDCGIGALSALGIKFLDKNFEAVEPNCLGLLRLYKIDREMALKELKSAEFIVLTDVTNPLTGKNGAIVYASQKGAHRKDFGIINRALISFKKVILKEYGVDLDKIKGAGAAGGIAGGMAAILNGHLVSGFEFWKKITGIEKFIRDADLIITGEGRVDKTTFYGKGVGSIVNLCQKYKKPIVLVCGQYEIKREVLSNYGVIKVYSLLSKTRDKDYAVKSAPKLLSEIGEQIINDLIKE